MKLYERLYPDARVIFEEGTSLTPARAGSIANCLFSVWKASLQISHHEMPKLQRYNNRTGLTKTQKKSFGEDILHGSEFKPAMKHSQ